MYEGVVFKPFSLFEAEITQTSTCFRASPTVIPWRDSGEKVAAIRTWQVSLGPSPDLPWDIRQVPDARGPLIPPLCGDSVIVPLSPTGPVILGR